MRWPPSRELEMDMALGAGPNSALLPPPVMRHEPGHSGPQPAPGVQAVFGEIHVEVQSDLDQGGGRGHLPDREMGSLGGVARGGALNLVAAVVYGAANFALLWVLNHELGTETAGVALVAIAAFNILARVAELGSATGLIRWISRLRAVHAVDVIPKMMAVSLVPVVGISLLFAWLMGAQSTWLADLFANGTGVPQLARVFLALAPLLPLAVIETVLVSSTRGYEVMWPQAVIEKIGRALLLPVVVLLTTRLGGDVVAVARVWALTNLVALIPAVVVSRRLLQAARLTPDEPRMASVASGADSPHGGPSFDRTSWPAIAKAFWAFSAPRAAGQTFEVSIAWIDTLLVSALVSTQAAGVYASGTRYVVIGAFISEAIMQVVGPRVSSLMARHRGRATSHLVRTAAGWQTALTWPIYLVTIGFAPVLLGVFGPEVLAAQGALIALSLGLMAFSLFGPAGSVILMGGKSSQAMGNAGIAVVFNLVGNLVLIPRLGITGAGVIWALTLVLLVVLPAWQAHQRMGLNMISRPAAWSAGLATASVGVVTLLCRVSFGATWLGLIVAVVGGTVTFVGCVWRFRSETGLDRLLPGRAQSRHGRLPARLRSEAATRPLTARSTSERVAPARPATLAANPRPSREAVVDGEDTPTLADYLGLARRRFVIIAMAGVLGALFGLAYLAKAEPGYQSTARIVLEQAPTAPGSSGTGGISPVATLTATQKSILRSDEVAQRAAELLGDDVSADQLRDHSSVTVLPDSLALDVSYLADDPAAAQAGAQALVDSYLTLRQKQEESRRSRVINGLDQQVKLLDDLVLATSRRLEDVDPEKNPTKATVLSAQLNSQLSEQSNLRVERSGWQSMDSTTGNVVSPATLPVDSTSLGAPVVLVGVVAAALVVGFLVALIRDRTDPRVHSSQDIQELVGATPVNVITTDDDADDDNKEWFGEWYGRAASRHAPGVEVAGNGNGAEAESYRRLALRLGGWEGPGPRFLLVTSAGSAPAEEVAANLAVTLGREGSRVLLIWSNLRQDTLGAYFSVPRGPGLGEVLANTARLEDAVLEIPGCQGLYLLPVGSRAEARDQLFRFSGLKDALTDPNGVAFDQVVLIAPSPTDYADALALAPQVDGVLVTVESESADRKELTATVESLRSINAHLSGVVAL